MVIFTATAQHAAAHFQVCTSRGIFHKYYGFTIASAREPFSCARAHSSHSITCIYPIFAPSVSLHTGTAARPRDEFCVSIATSARAHVYARACMINVHMLTFAIEYARTQ